MRPSLLLLTALMGCASPDADAPADSDSDVTGPGSDFTVDDVAAPGTYGVGVRSFTWVDETRETPAHGETEAIASRTLRAKVWYPADDGMVGDPASDAAPASGSFPLVVFSHGYLSTRDDHAQLGSFLASHGYVFAAPEHPLSRRGAVGGTTVLDVVNQPGDQSFVIDQILDAGDELAAVVDGEHIALGGLSLGGMTTLLGGLYPPLKETRADALIAVAAPGCSLPMSSFDAPTPPLLVVHGDIDAIVPYADNALPVYEAADAPKVLVTLKGGTHTGFPDLSAGFLDAMDNADSLGCDSIAGNLPEGGDISDLLEGETPLMATCAMPCEDELPTGAMKPTRQVVLLQAAVRAFLDVQFRDADDMQRFLVHAFAEGAEDVAVEAVLK